MKANELRIGNWVYGNKPYKVTGGEIALYEGREKVNPKSLPLPILLTEEWLVKFGFRKQSGMQFKMYYKNDFLYWLDDGVISVYDINFRVKCEYVHQLQNLYYAITGIELG